MTRILFVCTGNICRSPTAEGVARAMADTRGLAVHVESAGTTAHHVGEAPDRRAQAAALRRGYDLSGQLARRLAPDDHARFDHLVALDRSHLAVLNRRPAQGGAQVSLLMDWAQGPRGRDVPDPYYGDEADYLLALEMIEAGVAGLLDAVAQGRG